MVGYCCAEFCLSSLGTRGVYAAQVPVVYMPPRYPCGIRPACYPGGIRPACYPGGIYALPATRGGVSRLPTMVVYPHLPTMVYILPPWLYHHPTMHRWQSARHRPARPRV